MMKKNMIPSYQRSPKTLANRLWPSYKQLFSKLMKSICFKTCLKIHAIKHFFFFLSSFDDYKMHGTCWKFNVKIGSLGWSQRSEHNI